LTANNPRKRRIALIGLGMVVKPHILSLVDLADRAEIAACFTPSAGRRAAFAKAYPDLPLAEDLDKLFADGSIDAVFLLTPPFTHLELIERAARHGKHVVIEKPLDVSVARATHAVEAMERAGLKLGIVLQYRFRKASHRLAGLIKEGRLGKLISGSAAIRWWRPPTYFAEAGRGMKARDGGGVLLTQAIHTLDLFQSLARRIDTEDIVGAAIEFANGAVGTIDATTVAYPGYPERIELACEHATATLEAETLDVHFKDGGHLREEGAPSRSGGADPMAFRHEAHRGVIADFLDALDTGREPVINGREALKVQRLIEAMLRSSAERRFVEVA